MIKVCIAIEQMMYTRNQLNIPYTYIYIYIFDISVVITGLHMMLISTYYHWGSLDGTDSESVKTSDTVSLHSVLVDQKNTR